MQIRLTENFPQPSLGKLIPKGTVIDAPPALSERLLRSGKGILVRNGEEPQEAKTEPKVNARKKVKRNA